WRELGDAVGIARSCVVLGRSLRSEDDYAAAHSLLQESLEIERELGNPWQIAQTLQELGHVARDLRDEAAARAYFAESVVLWRGVGDDVGTILGLVGVAMLSYLDGDFPTARRRYEEGVAIARKCSYRSILPGLLQMSGEVARCEADYGRAGALYREALSW